MTNVNERAWFKGLDVGAIFQKVFLMMGFRKKSMTEIIDSIQLIPKECREHYKNFFEGVEDTWTYDEPKHVYPEGELEIEIITLSYTSWVEQTKRFKVHDRAWDIFIHRAHPMTPLFPPPILRTENFTTNFSEYARVCKEATIHFPRCSRCKRQLMWRIISTKNFEEMYIQYDNRELYCANKTCSNYLVHTGLRVTDIVLPSERDTKIFLAPFVRSIARRKRNIIVRGENPPIPKRWIRFWTKRGHVFPRTAGVYANDTAVEKQSKKLGLPDYTDNQYEHLHPFPNG